MGALKFAVTIVALGLAMPAQADSVARWQADMAEASRRFGVPEVWIAGVMRAESDGRTTLAGRPITSRAGAMGLMQLMPATWATMRARLGLGTDPHNPHDNILAGTGYLRLMYDRFGYPGLFAAYNAGPGRFAEHLATGRALPGETRAYLASIAATKSGGDGVEKRPRDGLFFALKTTAAARNGDGPMTDAPGLFVALRSAATDP